MGKRNPPSPRLPPSPKLRRTNWRDKSGNFEKTVKKSGSAGRKIAFSLPSNETRFDLVVQLRQWQGPGLFFDIARAEARDGRDGVWRPASWLRGAGRSHLIVVNPTLETVLKLKGVLRQGILAVAEAVRAEHPHSGLTDCAKRKSTLGKLTVRAGAALVRANEGHRQKTCRQARSPHQA